MSARIREETIAGDSKDQKTLQDNIEAMTRDIINSLVELGNVILVFAAGNEVGGKDITSYPARLGADPTIKNVVIAVGVDDDYIHNKFEYNGKYKNFVWAPGVGVQCAGSPDDRLLTNAQLSWDDYFLHVGGTSVDARMTEAIDSLKNLAFARESGGVPIIHNGIVPDQWPLEDKPKVHTTFTTAAAKISTTRLSTTRL
ncbi:hypothetical protein H072_10771 [Dactylellina haptotyla CBS 200.50]|uniref:Peptidase S8/S53 domain-containing protein n=1 Tax=Dactylellina haptotyla (strain CBS 200.50) TaxID=1284197 RepID=S7ZZ96_DACHA|nr:hypothetical protein H072_10771 [Dactylellina haptotyla CBS 200.50]